MNIVYVYLGGDLYAMSKAVPLGLVGRRKNYSRNCCHKLQPCDAATLAVET